MREPLSGTPILPFASLRIGSRLRMTWWQLEDADDAHRDCLRCLPNDLVRIQTGMSGRCSPLGRRTTMTSPGQTGPPRKTMPMTPVFEK